MTPAELQKKHTKLKKDLSLLTGKNTKSLNPLDEKKAQELRRKIREVEAQMENPQQDWSKPGGATRTPQRRRPSRTQPNPFRPGGTTRKPSSVYNKGGYAKCGASNPPSKKR